MKALALRIALVFLVLVIIPLAGGALLFFLTLRRASGRFLQS